MFWKQRSACPSTVGGTVSSGFTPSWPETKTSRDPAATSMAWL